MERGHAPFAPFSSPAGARDPRNPEEPMTQPSTQLAPPGTGVPAGERVFGWWLVRVAAACPVGVLLWRLERVSAALVAVCPGGEGGVEGEEKGTRRVLVPRNMGIEDSSRFWSGAMVLEHLTIVGRAVTALVGDLSRGRGSSWVLRTQDVKPAGGQTRAGAVAAFEGMVREFAGCVRGAGRGLSSRTRHQHPWFGPLRCRQWVAFVPLHHMVHLKQMIAIRDGLRAGGRAPPPPPPPGPS
jgi:hypothetical protein